MPRAKSARQRQSRDKPDWWYEQAKQELALMQSLDRQGPATIEVLAVRVAIPLPQVHTMLVDLRQADCVACDRKTGTFSLIPYE